MAIQSIFVITEKIDALSELCFGAKKLCDTVTAFLFGDKALAEESAACGANSLIYCPLGDSVPEDYSRAIAAEIRKTENALVILSNTIRGRLLAGKIGVYLDTAVLSNVSEISSEGDKIICKRTVYGGTAQSSQEFSGTYGVITVGSGVFGDIDKTFPASTNIAEISGKPSDKIPCIAHNKKKEGTTNLAAAKRIVDVGRGLAAEEDLSLMKKLASVLDAEVGCSRPVAENNKWMPKSCYLGVTGVQVKPDLCFSIGVSGQVQHIAGIDKSKVIIAVNKDKNAPIFKNADFGIAGDLYKVIPALIEKLS